MQTQLAPSVQNEAADLMASLLSQEFKPSTEYVSAPSYALPERKFIKVGEIKGEVEIERELDYSISVCAQCGKANCSCLPRRLISVKQVLRYPVECTLATQVALS